VEIRVVVLWVMTPCGAARGYMPHQCAAS